MDLQKRITAFVKLGEFIGQFSAEGYQNYDNDSANDHFFDGFKHQIKLAHEHNGWFTKENITFTLQGWSKLLTNTVINQWVEQY